MTALALEDRPASERHNMLGLQLDYHGPDTYLAGIIERARRRQGGYCCVTNVHQCILVHEDAAFAARVNGATYVISDSIILQRARSLRYGVPFLPTPRGADLMLELCRLAAETGVKVALVGGKDDTMLVELRRRLQGSFPNLNVACAVSPPFRELSAEEDLAITEAIRMSGAGLVFVGLGCPKQENWMAEHSDQLNAMLIGVGAAFDFNAGVVQPSPPWVHRSGFEWAYRLLKEPRRLWRRYFETSPRFLWLLLLDYLRTRS